MKKHILPAIKLSIACIILLAVLYPLAVWAMGQLSPNHGKGKIITYNGKRYYSNIGQSFTADKYFWSRPSAINYNAAGSGGSNKGPSNQEYLKQVQARIDTFMAHNPTIDKSQIPVDLVTASGSGLDPDISVKAAKVQVKRIARVRQISEIRLNKLINDHIEKSLWGLFGPEKINVLKLNIALNNLSRE